MQLRHYFLAIALSALAAGATATQTPNASTDVAVEAPIQSLSQSVTRDARLGLAAVKNETAQKAATVKALEEQKRELTRQIESLKQSLDREKKRHQTLTAVEKVQATSRRTLDGAMRGALKNQRERLQTAVYAHDARFDAARGDSLQKNADFPSIDDLRWVSDTILSEIRASGETVDTTAAIALNDGTQLETRLIRLGAVTAAAQVDGDWLLVTPNRSGSRLMVTGRFEAQGFDAIAGKQTATASLDLSGGKLLHRYEKDKSLFEHLQAGGNLVWVIVAIGLVALVLGLVQLWRLNRTRLPSMETMVPLLDKLAQGQFKEVIETLRPEATRKNPTALVLVHILDEGGQSVVGMEKSFEEADSHYLVPLKHWQTFVAVAAGVAPLLGLLGTVTGMISTFDVITLFGNGDPKLLSGGISVALITTEVGLVVSIVLMFVHYLMKHRFEQIAETVEEYASVAITRACSYYVRSPLDDLNDV